MAQLAGEDAEDAAANLAQDVAALLREGLRQVKCDLRRWAHALLLEFCIYSVLPTSERPQAQNTHVFGRRDARSHNYCMDCYECYSDTPAENSFVRGVEHKLSFSGREPHMSSRNSVSLRNMSR